MPSTTLTSIARLLIALVALMVLSACGESEAHVGWVDGPPTQGVERAPAPQVDSYDGPADQWAPTDEIPFDEPEVEPEPRQQPPASEFPSSGESFTFSEGGTIFFDVDTMGVGPSAGSFVCEDFLMMTGVSISAEGTFTDIYVRPLTEAGAGPWEPLMIEVSDGVNVRGSVEFDAEVDRVEVYVADAQGLTALLITSMVSSSPQG